LWVGCETPSYANDIQLVTLTWWSKVLHANVVFSYNHTYYSTAGRMLWDSEPSGIIDRVDVGWPVYHNSLHCAVVLSNVIALLSSARFRVVALTTFIVPFYCWSFLGEPERRDAYITCWPTDGRHVIRYVTLTADVYLPRRRSRPGHVTGHQLREMARWTLLHTRRPWDTDGTAKLSQHSQSVTCVYIYTVSQKKNVHLFIFQITPSKIDRF